MITIFRTEGSTKFAVSDIVIYRILPKSFYRTVVVRTILAPLTQDSIY